MSTTFVALSRSAAQYTVNPVAWDGQRGCVLLREQEGRKLKPIDYCSRSLCIAERSYDTANKKCPAIVWSF